MKIVGYNTKTKRLDFRFISKDDSFDCEDCFGNPSYAQSCERCKNNRYFRTVFDSQKNKYFEICIKASGKKMAKFYSLHLINITDIQRNIFNDYCDKCKDIKKITAHNTKNFNSSINVELQGLIREEDFLKSKDRLEFIKNQIQAKPSFAASTLENVIRLAKHTSIFYGAMDYYTPKAKLKESDKNLFKIHGLIVASFYILEPDFNEKGIEVIIGDAYDYKVYVDYSTIKTAFVQLLDNALKYSAEKSKINIDFKESKSGFLEISFKMRSLCMLDEDLSKIILHGERGILAERYAYRGEGIGMGVIEKMVTLNGGNFSFRRLSDMDKGIKEEVMFCEQLFTITLPNKKL